MTDRDDWQVRLTGLAPEISALRRRVAKGGTTQYRLWRKRIERRRFAPSALNLAHYLRFRRTRTERMLEFGKANYP